MQNIELSHGLILLRIVSLKLENEVEMRILISRFFHSHIAFGKKIEKHLS